MMGSGWQYKEKSEGFSSCVNMIRYELVGKKQNDHSTEARNNPVE
ncbi:MAG: hypothetical protein WCI64_04650 [Chlorobium sp.]